jgi:hypothetical protein
MKSKITPIVFLIFLSCFIPQKSNSQSFTSVKFGYDTLLYDGAENSFNYTPLCSGKVSRVIGCGQIIRGRGACGEPGSSSAASVGADVLPGDKIQTCGQSLIEVEMSDGSIYRSAPFTEFTIEESACNQGAGFIFRVAFGSLYGAIIHELGGDYKYEFLTENTAAGPRGTKFLIKVTYDTVYNEGDRSAYNVNVTTTVACLEGAVDVRNRNGSNVTDTASQVRLYEDFAAGRITIEEMQRRLTEIAENNFVVVNAGMQTTVYNQEPPSAPVPTRYRLEDFSPENFSK